MPFVLTSEESKCIVFLSGRLTGEPGLLCFFLTVRVSIMVFSIEHGWRTFLLPGAKSLLNVT
jgi:hypothetical protein